MSDKDHIIPIFLFSLPRSGSTLLQRVLAEQPGIASQSEMWFLLPIMYSLKRDGVMAVYGHDMQVSAIADMCNTFEDKRIEYLRNIENYAKSVYSSAAGGDARYFVDKTPRYHLIAEEILETFPDAKFVVLWRNPLSIISSIIKTWGGGKWNLYLFYVDLYRGLDNLINVCSKSERELISVQYESFVRQPEKTCNDMLNYLNLGLSNKVTTDISPGRFSGQMGDQAGGVEYKSISTQSCDKWKLVINNPVRRYWCKCFLKRLGIKRLKMMGYDQAVLIDELYKVPMGYKYVMSDMFRMLFGVFYRVLDIPVFKRKLEEYRIDGQIYPHG